MLFTKCSFKVALTLAIIKELLYLKVMEADNIPVSHESRSVMSDSLRPHGLYSPWNSLGQNTRVGSYFLFQRIFPTQGWNPGLPHCRRILYHLSYQGSPSYELCIRPFSGCLPWWFSRLRICLQCRRHGRWRYDPWVGKIPWRRKWQPTPVFLPEKSHGQRSLVGYSPRGGKSWTWQMSWARAQQKHDSAETETAIVDSGCGSRGSCCRMPCFILWAPLQSLSEVPV